MHDNKRTAWLWRPPEVAVINDRRRGGRRRGAAGVAAILGAIAILATAAAQAATTITVNALNDDYGGVVPGNCTLRDAINSAQGGAAVGSCNYTADTAYLIVFESGLTGTISLGGTLPAITGDLTIQGPGVAIDGGSFYQIFVVNSGASLTLDGLTITGGNAGWGGGILNYAALTVDNCTFDSNSGGWGGGIYNDGGTVTVTDSTFSNNTGGYCGGIYNDGGTVTVTDSTFSDNTTSGDGGAIYNDGSGGPGATVTVTNCTFSGNSASDVAGGIFNTRSTGAGATATITASTFDGNSATNGGGAIYNDSGTVSVKSTILASSTGGNCYGTIGDAGYNITDDGTCSLTQGSSTVVSGAADLYLDPTGLQDNGGPTFTIALEPGSPAIDAIPLADCTDQSGNAITADQRGETRPDYGEGFCDIGAFEYQDTGASFAGTPGAKSCVKDSVSALDTEYGSMKAAASVLGYPNPGALRADIRAYCAG